MTQGVSDSYFQGLPSVSMPFVRCLWQCREKAEGDQAGPSRRDYLIQTTRGRRSPVGTGVPMKGEGDTCSLYRGFGEWEVKCS